MPGMSLGLSRPFRRSGERIISALALQDQALTADAHACPQPAVKRAILQALVDTEKRSVLANMLCWIMAAGAAVFLPTAQYYVIPLAFRLLAMVGTRTAFARLRASLKRNDRIRTDFNWLAAALVVGGAAWGATMVPVFSHPTMHAARLMVGGSTLIGTSVVVTMLSPVPRLALSFIAGFLIAFVAGMWILGTPDRLALSAGMVLLFAIFLAYSRASTFGQMQSARLLVENKRLSEDLQASLERALHLAEHDSLTGLLNRRAFFSYAELTDWTPRVVIMVDIDHFKAINDRYGHAVGDRVLEHMGRAIRTVLSRRLGADYLAARLGGEEFAVMIPAGPAVDSRLVVADLRGAIAAVASEVAEIESPTTASLGVAQLGPGQTLDDALQMADAGLYLAKASGRDRAEWANCEVRSRQQATGLVRQAVR